jgi:hypothetical protein
LAAVSPPLLETKALRFLLAPCNASPQSPTGSLDVVSALLGLAKCPAWPFENTTFVLSQDIVACHAFLCHAFVLVRLKAPG